MPDSLTNETLFVLIKWLVIITVWMLLAIDLVRDHARVVRIQDSFTVTKILYVLHKRNIHLFAFFSLLLVALAATDLGQNNKQKQEGTQEESTAATASQPAVEATAAATKPADPSTGTSIPHNPTVPFGNITEFNEKNAKQQAYIDFLKERYETWLITYYYLQKCEQVSIGDLDLILGSLKKELDANKADLTVQTNIVQAATGSYQEMYSNIPCDAEHETKTKASYDTSMKRLLPQTEKPKLTTNVIPPSNDTPSATAPAAVAPNTAPVTPVTEATVIPVTTEVPAATPQKQ